MDRREFLMIVAAMPLVATAGSGPQAVPVGAPVRLIDRHTGLSVRFIQSWDEGSQFEWRSYDKAIGILTAHASMQSVIERDTTAMTDTRDVTA